MSARDIIIETIKLDDIFIVGNRRPLVGDTVAALAQSIASIGLQHPITVRYVDHLVDEKEGELDGAYVLVAGRHRLEAARSLDHQHIECVVVRWDERQARKWEIAENLHRADLTELQRKQEIAEWIAITEAEQEETISAQVEPKMGRGRPEGGVNAAARELGVERNEAQRAVKIASISERAKEAAVAAKLDNNQSALLKVASVTADEQVERVRQLAAERDARAVAPRKPISPAPAVRNEFESYQAFLNKVVKLFDAAPQEWRDAAINHLRADLPVMDRGAA